MYKIANQYSATVDKQGLLLVLCHQTKGYKNLETECEEEALGLSIKITYDGDHEIIMSSAYRYIDLNCEIQCVWKLVVHLGWGRVQLKCEGTL